MRREGRFFSAFSEIRICQYPELASRLPKSCASHRLTKHSSIWEIEYASGTVIVFRCLCLTRNPGIFHLFASTLLDLAIGWWDRECHFLLHHLFHFDPCDITYEKTSNMKTHRYDFVSDISSIRSLIQSIWPKWSSQVSWHGSSTCNTSTRQSAKRVGDLFCLVPVFCAVYYFCLWFRDVRLCTGRFSYL